MFDLLKQLLLQNTNPIFGRCVWYSRACKFPRTLWCFAPVVALRLNDAWIVHGSGPPTVFPPAPISSLLSQHGLTALLPFSLSSTLLTGLHTEPCAQAGRLTDRQADMEVHTLTYTHWQSHIYTLPYFIWSPPPPQHNGLRDLFWNAPLFLSFQEANSPLWMHAWF